MIFRIEGDNPIVNKDIIKKYNLYISFMLHNEGVFGFNLEFSSENINDINFRTYLSDYINLFDLSCVDFDIGQILIQPIQKNTVELQSKISAFIEKYKKSYPQLHQLMHILKKVDIDALFIILPYDISLLPTQDKFRLEQKLSILNDKIDLLDDLYILEIDQLLSTYNLIDLKNDKKIKIGESSKAKRVCRFCAKSIPETTFNNESHAISEALGNKVYILNEECDSCNEYFSTTIEVDIIRYLQFWNTFYGVKNKKNKIPKINQPGKYSITTFDLLNESNLEIKHNLNELVSEKDYNNYLMVIQMVNNQIGGDTLFEAPPEIKLEHKAISCQNIYKALVKFSLSLIDSGYLNKFKKTLEWVRSPTDYKEKLPLISILFSHIEKVSHPKLSIYIQKENVDKNLPYAVGIFNYTAFHFVFIIPTFDGEEDFTKEIAFNNFKEKFGFLMFEKLPWIFKDFSNSERIPFQLNLKFEPINKQES